MKNLLLFLAAVIVLMGIWNDLSVGSLPSAQTVNFQKEVPAWESDSEKEYQSVTVKAGDTVLSIADKLSASDQPIDIAKVVDDFKRLNNGLNPEDIQSGQAYKFPVY
ncbi:LysM repeat protein [Bacillus ectoiniformans]|uniref:LysM peptidoglycan-binding domain-containing protein n=1 Tax=Bacillus ectoiniformans TaxID=1494429 RepID=UPI00195893AB|nr:LysM domain-containing protein [Bacillus ectoiniformans]MBM7650030.1 LysM repeat protein [Bacillus ectoiniformans]